MAEFEWYHWVITLGGGFLAGFINTLAGNGSVVTLAILTDVLGLPGNIANGTNRVGVLFQSISSTATFRFYGKLKWSESRLIVLWMLPGALAGILTAMFISNEGFMAVYKFLLVALLFTLIFKPSRWIIPKDNRSKLPYWLRFVMILSLGFYGGFIQMGMGLFFLAMLVILLGYDLITANAIKILAVGVYTTLALFLFWMNGQVVWLAGLLLAAGQVPGGMFGAWFASRVPNAETHIYRLLIVIIGLAALSAFGVFQGLR
nr:sulfite exporter TauE/SafE family protein [Saprospiraceae bacterium]